MSSCALHQLKKGEIAEIVGIDACETFGELDALVSRRLADLGFSRGTKIELIALGVFGQGPYAVRLGNQSQFSLRHAEAGKIRCKRVNKEFDA